MIDKETYYMKLNHARFFEKKPKNKSSNSILYTKQYKICLDK